MVKYRIEITDEQEEAIGEQLIQELLKIINDLQLDLIISYKEWQ